MALSKDAISAEEYSLVTRNSGFEAGLLDCSVDLLLLEQANVKRTKKIAPDLFILNFNLAICTPTSG